jgi:hypothetical protein
MQFDAKAAKSPKDGEHMIIDGHPALRWVLDTDLRVPLSGRAEEHDGILRNWIAQAQGSADPLPAPVIFHRELDLRELFDEEIDEVKR